MEQEQLKEKIIEVTLPLFLRLGIRSVTMDEIAHTLCISKKTIYQFFKDKEELIYVVTDWYLKKEVQRFKKTKEESENAIMELYRISKFCNENHSNHHPGLLFDLEKFHSGAFKLYLNYREDCFYASLVENLRSGIREGYYREDLNIEVMARLRAREIEWSFNKNIFPDIGMDFSELHMQLLFHFIYGITTEKGLKLFNSYFKTVKQ